MVNEPSVFEPLKFYCRTCKVESSDSASCSRFYLLISTSCPVVKIRRCVLQFCHVDKFSIDTGASTATFDDSLSVAHVIFQYLYTKCFKHAIKK